MRFPYLTLLPILNDEAIYLDWGWRETHVPGYLYYSLYDGKQPLLMWFFGIFESIFSDPLFGGRLVSLLLGLLTTIGIYYIGRDLFSKRAGILAALTYITIPIFVTYDRLALIESAVTVSGVWGFYFVNKTLGKERSIKNEVWAGLILGLGFFSKSSALLFLISAMGLFLINYFKYKDPTYIQRAFTIFCVFSGTIVLLLINPQYWQTLSMNSRYVMPLPEIIQFPVISWFNTFLSFFQIGFIFLTPLIFLIALYQIFALRNNKKYINLILWLFIPLIIIFFTLRTPSQRYLVSFLPLLAVFFASFLEARRFTPTTKHFLIFISLLLAVGATLVNIYNPILYYQASKKISPYSDYEAISGHLSGYGVLETIQFLEKETLEKPPIVTYAENTGNPENAVTVYLTKKGITNGYFELKYLQGIPPETECIELQSGQAIYFISRNEQLAGFEKFVEKIKKVNKPLGTDTIGIYKFKSGCKNPMQVQPVFQQ